MAKRKKPVSPPKPKKVRRTKEWKRRSEASKKGWTVRKLKTQILDNRAKAKAVKGAKKRTTKHKPIPVLAKKAFEEKVRILDEKLKQERLEAVTEMAIAEGLDKTMTQEQFDQFVSDNPDPEWIREDGRIAKEPSRLRMLNRVIRHYIRASLNKALDNGHDIEEAMRIAQEFNVPLREVYALWASP
jgi:hypothetical protein